MTQFSLPNRRRQHHRRRGASCTEIAAFAIQLQEAEDDPSAPCSLAVELRRADRSTDGMRFNVTVARASPVKSLSRTA
jgi:hypothetical protein